MIKIERRHLKPYERLRGTLASEFAHPLSLLLLAVEFLNPLCHMKTAYNILVSYAQSHAFSIPVFHLFYC